MSSEELSRVRPVVARLQTTLQKRDRSIVGYSKELREAIAVRAQQECLSREAPTLREHCT